MSKYTMNISLNVLNHLGINLYSNVPSVLSEIVANSWDADASLVTVNINTRKNEITIIDNGFGMSLDDINSKFLEVGYTKRESQFCITPKYKRKVMGRKGIGKLSMFSIANTIEITSKKDGKLNAFKLDVEDIKKSIKDSHVEYHPKEIETTDISFNTGTKIVLKNLKKNINTAEQYLKTRIARRFSIIGEEYDFSVKINDKEVNVVDRDYFHKIEYLWYFGETGEQYINYCNDDKLEENEKFDEKIEIEGKEYSISGWLGLVKESGDLQDGDDNLNKIVVMVRNKMAQEDILEEFREGGMYTKYLFGEIHADFLDIDEEEDIATSSRQKVIETDPRYKELKKFISEKLKHIAKKRAEYKNKSGTDEALKHPAIKEWFNTLGKDTKSRAKKLFGKINQITTDKEHQQQLLKHGILAFETMRYSDTLDKLEEVDINQFEVFTEVFSEFDEIEKTLYYEITKGRVEIINKLKKHIDENALEKVLQEYLYDHLWLLDPAWDRISENPLIEESVHKAFDDISEKLTPEEQKGRMDIKYRKTSGKHIVIELKRASVSVDTDTLRIQVKKYMSGLEKQLENSGIKEPIEAICIVGKKPKDWETAEKEERAKRSLSEDRIRIITYNQLIHDSYETYKAYVSASQKEGKIINLINKLDS